MAWQDSGDETAMESEPLRIVNKHVRFPRVRDVAVRHPQAEGRPAPRGRGVGVLHAGTRASEFAKSVHAGL